MVVKVHLLAFKNGEIRHVTIPDEEVTSVERLLDLAFKYGQNDFQPQPLPSVSVGDVVEYEGQYHVVCPCGFAEMTREAFQVYRITPRLERALLLDQYD